MHILKTILRWILIVLCLTAMLAYGFFSVSGVAGLVIAVLALPIAPSRFLWKLILPSDYPRFAKEAILTAAFLLLLAASPEAVEHGATPEKTLPVATIAPSLAQISANSSASVAAPEISAAPQPSATQFPSSEPVAAADDEEQNIIGQNDTVYVSGSGNGKKYHLVSDCSNMKDPMSISRSEAEASGYTPCKRCCE